MKNNTKIKILVLFVALFTLSGCTKILKDSNNKVVKYDSSTVCSICNTKCDDIKTKLEAMDADDENYDSLSEELTTCTNSCETTCETSKSEATGQNLTANILCKPQNKDVIAIYEGNNVDIDSLPSCDNFNVFTNYEGLWISIFVKPLAWLLIKVGAIFNNYGLSLLLISIAIRVCLMPFTKKTAMQSENMKKAQPEIDKINKKYGDKTDTESQTKKAQETMMVYKKYDINPLSSCLFAFIQIPLLFAFIEAINRTPAIFEGKFLGLHLGLTPWQALKTGQWWYLILIIILALVTHFSLQLNKTAGAAGDDTAKQMEMMNKFMLVFIVYASFSLSTAICIYWISSSGFTIFQNLLVKKGEKK